MAQRTMVKTNAGVQTLAGLLKKPKSKNRTPRTKCRGLTNAKLREIMNPPKPPQSWYDEDHTGLY
jgi:hypothetical protein